MAMILCAAILSYYWPVLVYANQLTFFQLLVLALIEVVAFHQMMTRLVAYRVEHYTNPITSALHLLGALLPTWVISVAILTSFAPDVLRSPGWLLVWHILQVLLLVVGRLVQRVLIGMANRQRLLRRRVVIVGANELAEQLIPELSGVTHGGYDILGVVRSTGDDTAVDRVAGVPVLGDLETLNSISLNETIDIVVIALPWSRAQEMFHLMEAVNWIAADVVIPFGRDQVAPSYAGLTQMGRTTTLQVMSRPFKGSQGVLKVAEDYVVASVAVLLLSPLMLMAAIAIRLEGPGPILFRQWRPGFGRKPFAIYKFRTMHVNPNDDATIGTTGRSDPRITRVGAVLRRLSIDELPQIFNVLRGEMSIVGPRPYVANMLVGNERFSDLVAKYAERHRIKPGLTGYAQANGMRSYALRSAENARRSIEMDLHYMTHWSLWLDIKIMFKTLVSGLAGRNVF
ncbi:exopolysaccharide biosynthesis polyprenyl glycosylphosphotransferase [Roseomonas sp. SSH11]|uniref:Exopolysaccharide biosynthesis polyprenyl glycosylphosphotransferase n=2 Tax=Pararoseomonas baculiformis TaxID=2820812 RepID=A0ABS4AK39_9PROT|nr:exopolysaccharide biosynthesis polyprenyl glycosylphosphotransferase [Pararoseomonas baculiformis]MBP0447229.1 exopolysaccharide biosynthesis polyprenyl glycosylphosphotransferase [Pararoseomonas baculiformis]